MLLLVNHITWLTLKALKITYYSSGVGAMWRQSEHSLAEHSLAEHSLAEHSLGSDSLNLLLRWVCPTLPSQIGVKSID
jgi:hypothetical protein